MTCRTGAPAVCVLPGAADSARTPGGTTSTVPGAATLQGFKTFIASDVAVRAGTSASVRAVLAIGGLEEPLCKSS